jgi:hypothetical protein
MRGMAFPGHGRHCAKLNTSFYCISSLLARIASCALEAAGSSSHNLAP